jgi:outer membrane protein, heavy metal efflux system
MALVIGCAMIKQERIMFSNTKLIFCVIGFVCVSSVSLAEEKVISESISLQDAITATLNKNPSLSAYQFRHQALAGEKVTAELKPGWEVSGEIENLAGTGDYKGTDASEMTLSLSSVIELGRPQQARSQLVTARQAAMMSSEQLATADLLTKVTRQFIKVLAAQETMGLQQEFYKAAEDNLRSINLLIQSGRLSDAELLRAKAALAISGIELQQTQNTLNAEKIKLGLFWGDSSVSFSQVKAELFRFMPAKSLDDWRTQLQKNPDLHLLNLSVQVKEAEIKQINAESRTDITWNLGVRQLQATDDTAMVVGVHVPLGSKSRSSGALSTAVANQSLAEQERDEALLHIQAELNNLYAEYQMALNRVGLLKTEVLPLLEQAMVKTTKAFEQGRNSYLEFNLAQNQLLETKKSLIDAAAEAHLLYANIERLTANSLIKEN